MAWRLTHAEYERARGLPNKQALRRIVSSEAPTGVLGYRTQDPAGWCAVAPREEYVRLRSSRILKPVDARPVWSVSCFYVKREYRHAGVSRQLLAEAVRYAARHGAQIVEGYPQDVRTELPAAFAWNGLLGTFRAAGFEEVARRSKSRPIMRLEIRER
jgi:GNAT superfamily N-acetyltransferase